MMNLFIVLYALTVLIAFSMPLYFRWLASQSDKSLLIKVKRMAGGVLSAEKNKEIVQTLQNEGVSSKDISYAVNAYGAEYIISKIGSFFLLGMILNSAWFLIHLVKLYEVPNTLNILKLLLLLGFYYCLFAFRSDAKRINMGLEIDK